MDEFEARKRELLKPLLFEAGAALLDCQGLEYGVALLLFHFARLGCVGLDPQKVSLILENQDKKTAGQLITMLKKHVTVSEDLELSLEDALVARNALIHRVLIDNIERVYNTETRAELVKEIRALRAKVKHADKKLQPFIYAFNEALDGLDQKSFEAEVKSSFT